MLLEHVSILYRCSKYTAVAAKYGLKARVCPKEHQCQQTVVVVDNS